MKETPKQAAIRKAYGEHWDIVKNDIDEDGSIRMFEDKDDAVFWLIKLGFNASDYETIYSSIVPDRHRPKSLSGIDTNNGWKTIEEHGLPEYGKGMFNVFGNGIDCICCGAEVEELYEEGRATHYRPIEQVKPPIY